MRRLLIACVLLAVLLCAGCGTPQNILVIGAVEKQIGAFPLEFALKTGQLSKERFSIRYYSNEARLAEALAQGRVDAAALPCSRLPQAAGARIVCPLQREGGGLVCQAERFEDTAGLRIGVLDESLLPLLCVTTSARLGLNWNLEQFPDRKSLQEAYAAGKVQAVADAVPYVLGYGNEATSILWFGELEPAYPACDLMASQAAQQTKAAMLQEAATAARDVDSYINAYPVEAITRFMNTYPFREEATRKTLSQTWYYNAINDRDTAFYARAAVVLQLSANDMLYTP